MANKNPEVDWFFSKETKWQKEYNLLRQIALESGLKEQLKWGCPCYTFNETNVLLIHGFKEYCAFLFMKGVLIEDSQNILVQQTENVQSARQIRFSNENEIISLRTQLSDYITKAIEIEKAGLKVVLKKSSEFQVPKEFETLISEMPDLKTAFYNLTPGRQRGYLHYFSAAKQAKTREARILKHAPKILAGKGLED